MAARGKKENICPCLLPRFRATKIYMELSADEEILDPIIFSSKFFAPPKFITELLEDEKIIKSGIFSSANNSM